MSVWYSHREFFLIAFKISVGISLGTILLQTLENNQHPVFL